MRGKLQCKVQPPLFVFEPTRVLRRNAIIVHSLYVPKYVRHVAIGDQPKQAFHQPSRRMPVSADHRHVIVKSVWYTLIYFGKLLYHDQQLLNQVELLLYWR